MFLAKSSLRGQRPLAKTLKLSVWAFSLNFLHDSTLFVIDIHQNMPISLISTPFARFQIRLTLAVHPNLILEPCRMQTSLHLADHNCCTDRNKMECTAVKWEASQRSGGVSRSPSPRASCCCGTTPDTMPCCTMSLLNLLFHTLPCHCILVLVAAVPHHTKYQPMRFSAVQISSHYMGWPGGIPKSGVSEFSRGFGRQQLGTWCEHLGILPHLLLHHWY